MKMKLPGADLIHLGLYSLALLLAVIQTAISLWGIIAHQYWWNLGSLVHALCVGIYISTYLYFRSKRGTDDLKFMRTLTDVIILSVFSAFGILAFMFFAAVSMGSTVFLFLALVCEVAFVLIGGKEEDRWAVSMRQLTARRKLREAGLPK